MAGRIYRNYDQAALDGEYNNLEKVTDSADWLARAAVASAETRASLECRLDAAYGAHEELAAVWRSRGLPCQVTDIPRQHHFSIVAELENPGSTLSRLLLRQMGFR
jgi:hypothetical protein